MIDSPGPSAGADSVARPALSRQAAAMTPTDDELLATISRSSLAQAASRP